MYPQGRNRYQSYNEHPNHEHPSHYGHLSQQGHPSHHGYPSQNGHPSHHRGSREGKELSGEKKIKAWQGWKPELQKVFKETPN